MLSDKKRLEIANVCYANVAGQFAMFINPKFRGPNWDWNLFVGLCERQSDLWMKVNDVKGNRKLIDQTAAQFAKEIASTLVTRAGLLEDDNGN